MTVASQGEDEDASGLDVSGAVRAWRRGHRGGLAASWRPCSQPWSGCSGAVEEKGGRAAAPVGGSRAAAARGEKGGGWRLGFYSAGARASGWKR